MFMTAKAKTNCIKLLFLTLCLVFTLLPVTAWATTGDNAEGGSINPRIGACDFNVGWDDEDEHPIAAGKPVKSDLISTLSRVTFTGVFADSEDEQTKEAVIDASKDVSIENSLANAAPLGDLQFVAGNTYVVKQIEAPSGYSVVTNTPEVRVCEDGKFEFVDPYDVGYKWIIDENGVLIAIHDKIKLSIVPADSDGYRIDDYCKIQIWPDEGSAFADGSTEPKILEANYQKPNNASYIIDQIFDVVADNIYVMKAIDIPLGYAFFESEYKLKIRADGKYKCLSPYSDDWAQVHGEWDDEVKIRLQPNTLKLIKRSAEAINDAGQSYLRTLAGAKFKLVDEGDSQGQDKSDDITATSEKGEITIKKLLRGHTYTLTETAAAPGFAKAPGYVRFKVEEDGNLEFVDNTEVSYWGFDGVNKSITCDDFFKKVTVQVVAPVCDADGDPVSGDGPDAFKSLAGAVLNLKGRFTNKDGVLREQTRTLTVDSEGKVTFEGVVAGDEYEIWESKVADGYTISRDHATVSWDEDDNCTIKDANGAPVSADGKLLRITNDISRLKVERAGIDGSPFGNAEFIITPIENSKFADGSTGAKTITTDEKGKANLLAQIEVGGRYTIQETTSPTTSPAGWIVNDVTASFSVNDDGRPEAISWSDPSKSWTYEDGIFKTAFIPTSLKVKKTDGTVGLAEAKFAITPVGASTFADGSTEAEEITTGADGTVSFDGKIIVGESYELVEVKEPLGCILPAGDAAKTTIKIDDSGTFTLVAGADKGTLPAEFGVDTKSNLLQISDKRLSYTIEKRSTKDDSPVSDARFKVTAQKGSAFTDGTTSKKVTTDENGKAKISGLIAGDTYIVTEITESTKVFPAKGDITFSVANDNTADTVSSMITPYGYKGKVCEAKKSGCILRGEAAAPEMTALGEIISEPANGREYVVGETITCKITLTNTGNIALSDFEITNSDLASQKQPIVLKPDITNRQGESISIDASYTVTEADAAARRKDPAYKIKVTAKAAATSENDDAVTCTSNAMTSPVVEGKASMTAEETITSAPANGKAYQVGEWIEYSILITNTGNLRLSNISVEGTLNGIQWVDGPAADLSLAPQGQKGNSVKLTAKYQVKEADSIFSETETPSKLSNKAVVKAKDLTGKVVTVNSSADAMITAPRTYTLKVNKGKGSGVYAEGTNVTITADAAPLGQAFDKWIVVSGGVTPASETNASTTFAMPARAVEVTATYKAAPLDISQAEVSGISDKNYSGEAETQPGLTLKMGGTALKLDTDYVVSYADNVNVGTATITIEGRGIYAGRLTKTFQITLSKGKTYTVSSLKYKVTNADIKGKGCVTLMGTTKKKTDKKFTSLSLGGTVKIGGVSFKVTAVGDKAFKGYTKIKKVSLGNNVAKIGKTSFSGCGSITTVTLGTGVKTIGASAFYNCKNLSKLTIKSKKLSSVGSKAIKNIKKNATIDVPSSKVKAYKKLFKSSTGYKKTMKIK